MQLQYLNGIYPDAQSALFGTVQQQLLRTQTDVDNVVGGFDLDNYQGLNTAADTEKLRAYLIRTKRIADQSPALIQSTRNPETFSQMCAYVLQYWDTAEREQAALLMAQKERQQTEIAGLCCTLLSRANNKLRHGLEP